MVSPITSRFPIKSKKFFVKFRNSLILGVKEKEESCKGMDLSSCNSVTSVDISLTIERPRSGHQTKPSAKLLSTLTLVISKVKSR